MASEVGRVVGGRWEIERQLARGGMGIVWVAHHRVTRQQVALKVLYPDGPRQDELHERLLREAAAPAQIGHPGLVRVFDAGVDPEDGSMYLAMELLQGESLRDRFARPGLGRDAALRLVVQLLEPLAAAHALGFVHRDLKPQNAFIARQPDGSERAMLLDFGLTRAPGVTTVTAPHNVMGTAIYTAPEQLRSARNVGPQADVWSVGVTLYQILAGQLPFEGQTVALFGKILGEPPPPLHTVAPDAPPALAALVERCLAKDPKSRPADAGVLRRELAEALMASPVAPDEADDEPTHSDQATEPIPVQHDLAAGELAAAATLPIARMPTAQREAGAPEASRDAAGPHVADSAITRRRSPARLSAGRLAFLAAAAVVVGFGGVLLALWVRPAQDPAVPARSEAARMPAPVAPVSAAPPQAVVVPAVAPVAPAAPIGPGAGSMPVDDPTAEGVVIPANDTRAGDRVAQRAPQEQRAQRQQRQAVHRFEPFEPLEAASDGPPPRAANPRDCGPIVSAGAARCFVSATGGNASGEYMLRNLILAYTVLGDRARARPLANRYFTQYGTSPFARQIQHLGYSP